MTHETAWIRTPSHSSAWGPNDEDAGYLARIPVHSPQNEGRLYAEVRYLAGIAHLSRIGLLELQTSKELQAEQQRQPAGAFRGYGWYDYSVFQNIKMESIDGLQLNFSDTRAEQYDRIAKCKEPLFQALLNALGPKSSLDAYHIYTAEKHRLFGFLHIDFSLADKIRQNRKKSPFKDLKSKVLLPSQLAKEIKLLPVNTNLLTFALESDFPTRPDLNWPKENREHRRFRHM